MTRNILLVALLSVLVSGTTWGASAGDGTLGAGQVSGIDTLYGALLIAMLEGSQRPRGQSALHETRLESVPNETGAPGDETGLAAVYSSTLAGHRTASGSRYEPTKLTAAHKLLPFGTRVRVTNLKDGKTVELTITDRGPRQPGRVLDLSRAAARRLGIGPHGTAPVRVTVLSADPQKSST